MKKLMWSHRGFLYQLEVQWLPNFCKTLLFSFAVKNVNEDGKVKGLLLTFTTWKSKWGRLDLNGEIQYIDTDWVRQFFRDIGYPLRRRQKRKKQTLSRLRNLTRKR